MNGMHGVGVIPTAQGSGPTAWGNSPRSRCHTEPSGSPIPEDRAFGKQMAVTVSYDIPILALLFNTFELCNHLAWGKMWAKGGSPAGTHPLSPTTHPPDLTAGPTHPPQGGGGGTDLEKKPGANHAPSKIRATTKSPKQHSKNNYGIFVQRCG